MNDKTVRELLIKLQRELETTDRLDPGTLDLARDLAADIHGVLESGAGADETGSILSRANALESRFAASHPVAEQVLREIIDTLARIGV